MAGVDQAAEFALAPDGIVMEVTAGTRNELHACQERVEQDFRRHNSMSPYIAGMTKALAEMRLTVDSVIANNTMLTKNNRAFQQRIWELELQQRQLEQQLDCARATARLQELNKPHGFQQAADDDSAFDDHGAGNNDDSFNDPILYGAPLGQSQPSSSSSLSGLEDRFGRLGSASGMASQGAGQLFGQQSVGQLGNAFGQQSSDMAGQLGTVFGQQSSDMAGQLGTVFGQQPGGVAGQLGTVFGQQPGGVAGQLDTVFGQQPGGVAGQLDTVFGQQPTFFGQQPGGVAGQLDTVFGQPTFGQDFGPYGMTGHHSQHTNDFASQQQQQQSFDQPASGRLDNNASQQQETANLLPDLFTHETDEPGCTLDVSRSTDYVSPKRAKIAEPDVAHGNGTAPALLVPPAPLVTLAPPVLPALSAPLVTPALPAVAAPPVASAPPAAPAQPAATAPPVALMAPALSESAAPIPAASSTSFSPTSPAASVSSASPTVEAMPAPPPPALAVAAVIAPEIKIVIDTPTNSIRLGWIYHGEWVVYNRRAKIDDVQFYKPHVCALIAGRLVHPRWHQQYIDIMNKKTHGVAEANRHLVDGGRWLRNTFCERLIKKPGQRSVQLDTHIPGRIPPEWLGFLNGCLRIDNVNGDKIGVEEVCGMVARVLNDLFVVRA